MHLDADMVRNETHDALGVRRGDAATGVFEPRWQGDRSRDAYPD
jgi:hypothetical protein